MYVTGRVDIQPNGQRRRHLHPHGRRHACEQGRGPHQAASAGGARSLQ